MEVVVLLLLLAAASGVVSGGEDGAGGPARTYIMRVDANAKPSVFPTHAHWYGSAVLVAGGGVEEWPEGGPLIHTYSAALHGFSVRMSSLAAAALAAAPGVAVVLPGRVHQLATTRSLRFLGLLSSPPSALLANSDFGADLVIAIIDTGILPTQRSFDDRGLTETAGWRWTVAGAGRGGGVTWIFLEGDLAGMGIFSHVGNYRVRGAVGDL